MIQQTVSFSAAFSKIIDNLSEYGVGLGMIILGASPTDAERKMRGRNDSMLLEMIVIITALF